MAWIDPGEFMRGAAAREEARTDHEGTVLDGVLSAGWGRATADEVRRLHARITDGVTRRVAHRAPAACDETALGLVGEARGAALAEWWAQAHGLDERTARLLRECAAAAAALAIVDGYTLGAADCAGSAASLPAAADRMAQPVRHNGTAPVARVAALVS